jgi:hypothetical protein
LNAKTYQPAILTQLPHRLEAITPLTFQHVTLVAHADWSKNPAKRWVAIAVLQPCHHWQVIDLYQASYPALLFTYLKSMLSLPGCILAGFDFPIGLPSVYAAKASISHFLAALPLFGQDTWKQFYLPAEEPSQISLYRPFYPSKPGHSLRRHLEQALDIPFNHLFRLCEVGHKNRRPACPLFWTLGSQQVGKAAISGWESLLAPALRTPELSIVFWPFSGRLHQLCQPSNIVVVETYPAEFYSHLGLSFSTPRRASKRRQADRIAFAPFLVSWAHHHRLHLPAPVLAKIYTGFGSSVAGEDQFDALVGLYGMINVIQGNRMCTELGLAEISNIEGWIFGQEGP